MVLFVQFVLTVKPDNQRLLTMEGKHVTGEANQGGVQWTGSAIPIQQIGGCYVVLQVI